MTVPPSPPTGDPPPTTHDAASDPTETAPAGVVDSGEPDEDHVSEPARDLDPREVLLGQLGRDREEELSATDEAWIDAIVTADQLRDDGDLAAASKILRQVIAGDGDADIRRLAAQHLKRNGPDPMALAVALVCGIALLLIWFLAVA